MTNNKIKYRDIGRFCLHFWATAWRPGAATLVLISLAILCDVMVPVYIGRTVDALSSAPAGDAQALNSALKNFGIFIVLGIGFSLLRSCGIFYWNWFAVRALFAVVTNVTHKVQRFSADWHANAFAGATVRKITRGMWSLDMLQDTLLFGIVMATVMMIAMSVMLLVVIPEVGLFTIGISFLYIWFSVATAVGFLAPLFRESAAADTRLGAVLADIITGNPTVKSFGNEEREDKTFFDVAQSWRRKALRSWQSAQTIDLIRSLLRMVMMSGMLGLTIWLWSKGRASSGDIALVLTSFFIVAGYLRDIGMHISTLQKSASEMEDAVWFWMREDDIRDVPNAKPLKADRGAIEFDNVTFCYQSQERPVFKDFSIQIAPGEKIALVGPSGSGKSTFIKLLQRLYDVQSGEIRIDEQNIATVTQQSLRRAIALVPQDPVLFHRSLSENIAYGHDYADAAMIQDAAREAYAHDFIARLPLDYETLVGERGVKLSGGERQRVAIARAILSESPILVLDEATSSLDSISEHYIQKALEGLMENKTTITVAHRLATIRRADRILVFSDGQIVEQGTHDDLIRKDGSHYRHLYEMQALDLVGE